MLTRLWGLAAHLEQPAPGEDSVGDEYRSVSGDGNAAGLGELSGREFGLSASVHLEQNGVWEVAGAEALFEGENAVGSKFIDVESTVVGIEGDVLDRGEAGGVGRAAAAGPS